MSSNSGEWWLGPLEGGPETLIALCGPVGVGKTTTAQWMLGKKHGFIRKSFAQPTKEVARWLYDLDSIQTDGARKEVVDERYGLTPRFIMQRIGTDVFREIHPATWLIYMRRQLQGYPPGIQVVIDDLRFENEANAIRAWGGRVVELQREGYHYSHEHASEKGVEADYALYNTTPEQTASILAHGGKD